MKVKLFHENLSQLHKLLGGGEKKEAAQGQQGVRNAPSHLAALNASPLWDGALGMAVKLPVKVQIFRACQRLPLRGSWQSRQALTEGVSSQMDKSFHLRHFGEKAVGGFDFLLVFM